MAHSSVRTILTETIPFLIVQEKKEVSMYKKSYSGSCLMGRLGSNRTTLFMLSKYLSNIKTFRNDREQLSGILSMYILFQC